MRLRGYEGVAFLEVWARTEPNRGVFLYVCRYSLSHTHLELLRHHAQADGIQKVVEALAAAVLCGLVWVGGMFVRVGGWASQLLIKGCAHVLASTHQTTLVSQHITH